MIDYSPVSWFEHDSYFTCVLERCDCLLELVMTYYGDGGNNLENAKMLYTYIHTVLEFESFVVLRPR